MGIKETKYYSIYIRDKEGKPLLTIQNSPINEIKLREIIITLDELAEILEHSPSLGLGSTPCQEDPNTFYTTKFSLHEDFNPENSKESQKYYRFDAVGTIKNTAKDELLKQLDWHVARAYFSGLIIGIILGGVFMFIILL